MPWIGQQSIVSAPQGQAPPVLPGKLKKASEKGTSAPKRHGPVVRFPFGFFFLLCLWHLYLSLIAE